MNVDIDNAMQGVLHALIERHISREEAMERLRGIVGGMMPKQIAHVYDDDDMRSAFIDGWLGCITHSQRHCMADDVDNAVASWREWAKSIGIPTDEGDPT